MNSFYSQMKLSFIVVISFLIITIVSPFTADAAYFGGDRLNKSKPKAFYHSSVSSYGYTSNYDAGRAYWNAHSKVNITKSMSATGADIYYIGNSSITGLLGAITPYSASGSVVGQNAYWNYTTVYMYDNQMRNSGNFTNSRKNYNAAHEIGHTIKMAHVPIPHNSVMVQGWYNIPSSITSFDRGEVDKKW